jgi:hypothetical protein
MALLTSPSDACLADVWRAWQAMVPEPGPLGARLGWDAATVATIDAYRDAAGTYSFPRLDEVVGLLEEAGLVEASRHTPGYPLGERCPSLVFRRAP